MEPRRLVLIGGGAGTGKTSVARALSRSLGAGWLQVDTIWLALIDAAEPGSDRRRVLDVDRALRHGTTPPEDLLAHHLDAAAMVCHALPRALAFELQTQGTVVADGAWILPQWSAELVLDGIDVRPIFLHGTGRRASAHGDGLAALHVDGRAVARPERPAGLAVRRGGCPGRVSAGAAGGRVSPVRDTG